MTTQRIQRHGAELQTYTLRECNSAKQAQVHVEESRAAESVSAHVAETLLLAGGNIDRRERSAVEILVPRQIGSGGRSAFQIVAEGLHVGLDLVGRLTAAERVQIETVILDDADRRAAYGAHNAAHLESSQEFTENAFIDKLLSTAKRQLPEPVQLEVVGAVIARESSVALRLGVILNPRTAIIIRVVDRLREGIRSTKGRTGKAALERHLQSVVSGGLIRQDLIDVTRQPKSGQRAPGVAGSWSSRIDVDESHLANRSGADVADLPGELQGQLTLHRQIPGLDVFAHLTVGVGRRAGVRRQFDDALSEVGRRIGVHKSLPQCGDRDETVVHRTFSIAQIKLNGGHCE